MKTIYAKKLRRDRLEQAGIPKDYFACTLRTYEGPREHKVRVEKYVRNLARMHADGLSLCLFGENNAGKTTLAMILAKAFLINKFSVKVTNLRTITDIFCKWNDPHAEEEFKHGVKGVDFLVIDDLNKEFHNRMTHAVLDDVLRYRSNNHLPFCVTTNASIDELSSLYGPSFVAILERRAVMLEFKRDLKNVNTLVDRNLAMLDDIQ